MLEAQWYGIIQKLAMARFFLPQMSGMRTNLWIRVRVSILTADARR